MKKIIYCFIVFLFSFINSKTIFAENTYNKNNTLVEQHLRKDLGWNQDKIDYMIKNNPKEIERIGNEYLNNQNKNNEKSQNFFKEMFQENGKKYYEGVLLAKEKCKMISEYVFKKIETRKESYNFYKKSRMEQQKISENIIDDFAKNTPFNLKAFLLCTDEILPLTQSNITNEKNNVSKLVFILGRVVGNITVDEKNYLNNI
jgi:hypothetical protein